MLQQDQSEGEKGPGDVTWPPATVKTAHSPLKLTLTMPEKSPQATEEEFGVLEPESTRGPWQGSAFGLGSFPRVHVTSYQPSQIFAHCKTAIPSVPPM